MTDTNTRAKDKKKLIVGGGGGGGGGGGHRLLWLGTSFFKGS